LSSDVWNPISMTTSESSSRLQHAARPTRPRLRIACVYLRDRTPNFMLGTMAGIRFFRMAEALARRGHEVDIVLNRHQTPETVAPRLREIPFELARWENYQVVKTFFHRGFESLVAEGGGDHPFIISKLGSVVGREQTPGVHFYGPVREKLFATQVEIAKRSKVVTVLTNRSAALWWNEHGADSMLFQVPTGVDAEIPVRGPNPYLRLGIEGPVALFAGNIYSREQQTEINALWQNRLNRLGRTLKRRGITLVAMGAGVTDMLERDAVTHVGVVDVIEYWNWQHHAQVGIVLAQGQVQDNESSKIYYYLRTGMPVICEDSVPNLGLVEHTRCGAIVPYGDIDAMADAADAQISTRRDTAAIAEYMIEHHSWDSRAALYDTVLSADGPMPVELTA
jgi:glycosyltransferase involved in cell wall biosynthesis